MTKTKLSVDFDWQRRRSTAADLKSLDPLFAARMVFELELINRFEHELLRLKNNGCVWGPVHSSVGQEAVAAASMAALRRGDKIAGSHRAHHQFLSKVLRFVLDDQWDPAGGEFPQPAQEVVNRTLAEIMGLAPGYCGGRGGSMHLRHAEAGVLGTNAIVAGGIPLATGAAYAEKHRGTDNVVAAFFGDGAVNQGSFHEALNLAGLWKLPIVYVVENNEYAVATRSKDASAIGDLSLRGVSYAMKGRIVDGSDVVGIHGTVREAAETARRGEGPTIVEIKCYRHYHHAGDQPGSAYGYRDKEEEAGWLEKDAVKTFPEAVRGAGLLETGAIERIRKLAETAVLRALEFCTVGEDHCEVRSELWPAASAVGRGLRSGGSELAELQYSEIEDFQDTEEIKYSDAIAQVTGRWMEDSETVVEFGEEIANFGGGAYGATKGLPARFPRQVVNTPISEAGFIGLALGAAMSGLRPIVEIMFPDFTLVAADQVFNQIGKARHMYGGTTDLPLVARTRIATGCGYGGQHSMDPVGLYALFPGWRIVAPSNAFDYVGLFNTAMVCLDPVLFLEHHSLYAKRYSVPTGRLDYFVPFGKAKIVHPGDDITVLTYSSMTGRVAALIEQLERAGVSAEIVDLRTVDLLSMDYETIGASLKRTGVVAVVEEAAEGQSIGSRIAAELTRRYFDDLDAPPGCLTSLNVPNPVSQALERAAMISDDGILSSLEAMAKRRWH
jgi:2-oxoisovalerate dehydrogenase E1 component